MKKTFPLLMLLLAIFGSACKKTVSTSAPAAETASSAQVTPTAAYIPRPKLSASLFGMIDKDSVMQYTLKNNTKMEVRLTNYGATITHLFVPDKSGNKGDVLLGFNTLEGIRKPGNPFFGCAVGRYANRIAKASFTLDSVKYKLFANNGNNTLHGGKVGFDKKVWKTIEATDSTVCFKYISPDGEEGYPGTLSTIIKYIITNDNQLVIDYTATTDKATPINLSNHAYFNLSAGMDSTILNHELMLDAELYTPVDKELIPTGKVAFTVNTPFDFVKSKPIGQDIAKVEGGYDHNFIFKSMGKGGELYHPGSGRLMTLYTTEPAVQFYTGNFLGGTKFTDTKEGRKYGKHAGLCLETQHYPDSPNQPLFPNTILRPGQTYNQKTSYLFSIK